MDTADSNPERFRFFRRATLSGMIGAASLLPTACVDSAQDTGSISELNCVWNGRTGERLPEIAVSLTEQNSTPDQIQQGIDDIMDANNGTGAKLESPSQMITDGMKIIITGKQCDTYNARVKDGTLEDRYLDRVEPID